MIEILQQIGLTSSESKVYLALVERGKSKVSEILSEAKLNSGRIYEILESLEEKGLVSSIKEEKTKYFTASPPKRVIDYLNAKIDNVNKQKINYEKTLPELQKRYEEMQEETNVEVFLGVKGQKTAYEILFAEAKKDRTKEVIVNGIVKWDSYSKEYIDLLRFYVFKKRKELKLKVKKIINPSAKKNLAEIKEDNAEIRTLPYESMTAIQVLGEVTLIQLQTKPLIAIIIRNKQTAEDYKKQLKFLWSIAKEVE